MTSPRQESYAPDMVNIEALAQLQDNYAWLVTSPDANGGECAIVDPADAAPIVDLLDGRGLRPTSLLITHHHPDHVGGVEALCAAYPGLYVYCSEYDHSRGRVPRSTHGVADGDTIEALGVSVRCLSLPGHTLGAIAYHLPTERAAFTGDTLFGAGCGRLFEGTAAQMTASLADLAALPPDTRIYCGHEYTEKNLCFAASVEPRNDAIHARLQAVRALRGRGEPSVPTLLAEELQTNPFLRAVVGEGAFIDLGAASGGGREAVFAELRGRRDHF